MLVCIKDFQQYKVGDVLPSKLPIDIQKILVKDGFAEFKNGRSNARVADYIRRTKDNPKKNYKRKTRVQKPK